MEKLRTPPLSSLALTLKSVGLLLSYPDHQGQDRIALLTQVQEGLQAQAPFTKARQKEVDALIASMLAAGPLQLEAEYVQTFDTRRNQSLHLFEHVHGDSRDRGPAMIDLTQTYIQHGLYLHEGELPDYLPVVLQYASTQPPAQARAFLAEMAHIFNAIFAALEKRESRYASVLGALIEIAGETAHATTVAPDAPIDESWEEPMAFDGCSTQGQAKPGQPQPIRIVRKNPPAQGAST